ncbi:hypothetical protein OA253_02210 [Alphaproteobacteria bacterium]|nr:hypothetical protein [Alphaproteobacteria bacterium]
MKKIILFCSDGISNEKEFLTGGGLRSQQFVNFFKKYLEVIVVEPEHARNKTEEHEGYSVTQVSQQKLILKYKPDLAWFMNASACMISENPIVPFGIDIHGPISLESCFVRGNSEFNDEVQILFNNSKKVSYITTPSITQKNALNFLGLGYTKNDFFTQKIFTIPLRNLSNEFKNKTNIVLKKNVGYFGSIYPWMNPFPALNLVASFLKKTEKLILNAGPHSSLSNKDEVNEKLLILSQNEQTMVRGLISRNELQDKLNKIFCVLDLSVFSPERAVAVNTRVAEFIDLEIPVFVNDYSEYGRIFVSLGLNDFVIDTDLRNLEERIKTFLSKNVKERNQIAKTVKSKINSYYNNISDEDLLIKVLKG